jgi:HAE1 family hydrophobic/amphiphilic exporter-1
MWRISSFALRNATVVVMAVLLLAVGGIYSALTLKQELFPDISFPIVVVTTVYPGASPNDVVNDVVKPEEALLAGVDNVTEVDSVSQEGFGEVIAQFGINTDTKAAQRNVADALRGLQLPASAQTPSVTNVGFANMPVVTLSLEAAGGSPDLRAIAQNDVVPQLSELGGVGRVDLAGAPVQQVLVKANPAALAARGVSLQALVQALQADGVAVPAGQLTLGNQTDPVRVLAPYTSLQDIENIPIAAASATAPAATPSATASATVPVTSAGPAAAPRAPVHLRDVATVTLGQIGADTITRTNGRTSFTINVIKTPQANTVQLADAVRNKLPSIQRGLPDGVRLETFVDNSLPIKNSIQGMLRDALLGALLAVLIIFVFLRNLRATLVAIVSIPLAMLVSLILMNLAGISLNIMSLGGLAVATGRVVDDSIVVIENIFRRLSRRAAGNVDGMTMAGWALVGTREVSGAITSSTLTTVAVFLPLAFASGIVSKVFVPFALTVTFALLSSLLVALTVVPLLARWLFAGKVGIREREFWLARWYRPVLSWCLTHRPATLAAVVVVFAASLVTFRSIGTEFLPADARGAHIQVRIAMPTGTSLAVTDDAAAQLEQIIRAQTGVQSYLTTVGTRGSGSFGGGAGAAIAEDASITVTVGDNVDAQPIADALRQQSQNLTVDGVPARVNVSLQSVAPSGGGAQVNLSSSNDADLATASQRVVDAMSGIPGLANVQSNISPSKPEVQIDVDRTKAAAYGLSPQAVSGLLRGMLNQQVAAQATLAGGKTNVILYVDTSALQSAGQLTLLPVPAPTGGTVPLGAIADVRMGYGPTNVTRVNQQDTASITADITSRNAGAINREIQRKIQALALPSSVAVAYGGEQQSLSDAFSSLEIAMLVAIFLVYILMILAFRAALPPFAILFSLPVALIGVLLALFVTRQTLNISVLIGMLMLIGIVVTNAIVLVDKVQQLRAGTDTDRPRRRDEALVEAGALRLRPILMTAVATIFALIPLALGQSEGALISQSLAIAVIGGLLTSTILTLIVVPVVFSLLVRDRPPVPPEDLLGSALGAPGSTSSRGAAVTGASAR